MLAFTESDFFTSSKADLKYAESYTLVQFCMHGDGGRHRERFVAFMRRTYLGQSSATQFKDAMGAGGRELEDAWLAYVRATARQ